MNRRLLVASALSALLQGCAASSPPAAAPRPPLQLPDDLATAVHDAERLGRAIFEQDLAAARASDAVVAAMGDERDERIRGWISRQRGERWSVQFFAPRGDGFEVLWEATVASFGAGIDVEKLEPPRALDAEGSRMARARTTAIAQPFRACSERYNTVVLPASVIGGHGFLVYLLAATTTEGEWMVGGHQRFLVSEDGSAVVRHQPLSRGCLALPASPSARPRAGAWVTHIVSDAPAETHVFLSLLHQTPLFVGTRRGVWRVAGEKITFEGS